MSLLKLLITTLLWYLPLAAAQADTVGIRLSFEAATLDWNLGDVPIHVINNTIEGLYSVGAKGEIIPNEATSLPAKSTAKKIWKIQLRPNLKWSDGKPVRAQDYVDSWTRLLDVKTGSTYSYLLEDLKSARALSDRELEITFKNPISDFPSGIFTHWATYPIRLDVIRLYDKEWTKPGHWITNGPYQLATYQPSVKFELVPNSYHRAPGTLEKIEALIVPDDTTALRLYETGRIHFMPELASLDRGLISKRTDYHSQPSQILMYLGIDIANPLLSKPEARKALSHAIERSTIPGILNAAHQPTVALAPQMKSNASAGQAALLKNQSISFDFFEKGINRLLAEFLQAQWRTKLQAQVQLQGNEIKSYWKMLSAKPRPIFLNSYGAPVPDKRYYYGLLRSTSNMNLGRWKNDGYDRAVAAHDWNKAQAILDAEMPVIPLFFRAYDYLISPKLKGAVVNPMSSLDLSKAHFQK